MSKKQTLNADVEFDEVDNNYLPADTEFDEIDDTPKGASPEVGAASGNGSNAPQEPSSPSGIREVAIKAATGDPAAMAAMEWYKNNSNKKPEQKITGKITIADPEKIPFTERKKAAEFARSKGVNIPDYEKRGNETDVEAATRNVEYKNAKAQTEGLQNIQRTTTPEALSVAEKDFKSNLGKGKEEVVAAQDKLQTEVDRAAYDYIRSTSSPENAQYEISKYSTIANKKKNGEELTDAEIEYLFDTRKKSVSQLANESFAKAYETEQSGDFDEYAKDMAKINSIAKGLSVAGKVDVSAVDGYYKNYKTISDALKTSVESATSEYNSKIADIQKMYDNKEISDYEADQLAKEAKAVYDDAFNKYETDSKEVYGKYVSEVGGINEKLKQENNKQQANLNVINSMLEDTRQRTNVDESKIEELNKQYKAVNDLSKAVKTLDVMDNEAYVMQEEKRIIAEQEKEDPTVVGQFTKGFIRSLGGAVMNLGQLPQVITSALGDTDYSAEDVFADAIEEKKNNPVFRPLPKDAPEYLKAGYDLGSAVGSITSFAVGGQSKAAVAGIAFLTTESDAFREALETGMDRDDAAIYSSFISSLTALSEGIIPDGKYFADTARASVLRAIKNGKGVKDAISSALKELPKSAESYIETFGKEGLEEGTTNIIGSTGKTLVDQVEGKSYYGGFDVESLKKDILLGAAAGGFMNAFRRGTPKSKVEESAAFDMVENRDYIVDNLEQVDPETATEVKEQLDAAKENLDALKTHSNWDGLDDAKKAHVFAISEQIRAIEDSGLKDPVTDAQIERLNNEMNEILSLGDNGIDAKSVGTSTSPQRVFVRGEQANFFINEDGDYEIEYNNGKSVIIEKGDGAAEKIREMGISNDKGDVVGKKIENQNILVTPKLEKGATILYQGKNATVEKFTEKDGKVVFVQAVNEDGERIKIREKVEGKYKDGKELLSNLTNINEGKKQSATEDVAETQGATATESAVVESTTEGEKNQPTEAQRVTKDEQAKGMEAAIGEEVTTEAAPTTTESTTEPTQKVDEGDSAVVDDVSKKEEKIDTTAEQVEPIDTKVQAAKKKVSEVAEKIKKRLKAKGADGVKKAGIGSDEVIDLAVKAIHAAIDAGASISEYVRNQDWYKSLSNDEKDIAEMLISEAADTDQTPSANEKTTPDIFGETRQTERKRKRDSADNSAAGLVTKGVSNEYSSINAEKANAAAQAEFDKIKSDTDLSTVEGVDEATEFAEELLNTPSKSDEANAVKVLGALILDKIRSHVFVQVNSGNKDLSGKLAELDRKVEFYKRSAAQQMAFANPSINPDELSIAIELIEGERKAMMERRAKSGKTVEEVVDDIANLKPNESEVDEAANTVTVPDKPKAERKPSISKERKDRGLAKVKSGLAKLQAKAPGALSVLSPEKIEGIKEIASGAVDLGIYSLEGIANYVKKQVGKLVDHKDVDSVLGNFSELKNLVATARIEEAQTRLTEALQSGKGLLNAFANAIAMQDAEYAANPKRGSKSAIDKVLSILKDKTQAGTVVQTAIDNVLNQTILNPSLLKGLGLNKSDYVVSKSNPNGMTEEEFENFQRTVLRSQLEDAAAAFLDKGVFETDMTTAERPQRKKNPTTEAIREMVKEFYGKNFDNQTLEQKIVEQFDIDPADAAKIAQNVRNVLNQKMGKRTQAKVRALVQDLNDGKDNFTMQQAISRMLTTQGVVTNAKVQNELIKFLGKKGMTKAHINKIIALSNLYSQMPSNVARQQVATAMQNIIANYDQTTAAFFMKAVFGNIMRDILGNPRTAILTSTLSMLKTVPFDLGRAFLLNPGRFVRSVQYRNNMATRKFMPGKSVYASIISGERHFSQRFELDELQPKKRDTEWQRVRDTSWKDVINAIKNKDNKSIATAIVKSLQEISLMGGWMNTTIKGKKVELSPVQLMYNLMGAADLFAWSNIAMMNNYMVAERMARNEGIMAGSQELQDRVGELLALGINDLVRIEKIVKDEITQMASAGIPVPKAYETDRKKQLLTEFADKDVLIQASFEAEKSMLLNKPSTLAGAYVYKALSRGSEIKDNASWVSATYKLLLGTLVAFHKVGLNVVGRRGKNIPFYNIVTASWPYEYEVGKDGSVQKRKYESGEARNRAKDMTREYIAGLVWAGATTAFTMSLIENLFDYDDLEDEEGNKLLNAEGQPIKVWKMNPNSSIRFHGEKEELIGNAKRIAPKNSIELTWVQDPDKRYINFNWFPESWYPTLYLMGDLSDNIRYTDNKLLKDKMDIAQRENFNPERILLTSAMGAFDASFTTPVELTKETAKLINYGKPVDAVANIFYSTLLKPAADATSPRFADQVAQGVAYFNGREKSYVRMSIQNKDAKEGLTNLAQKWLSDTWWGEQIQGTADGKFSVVDAHGKPITYDPGDLLFVPSMIMEDMNFSFYDHVSKDKLFNLYLNEKGLFDESVIAPPSKVSGLQDYSEELKDKIKKEVPVMYGKLLEESYTSLADMEFAKRADLMKYIYRLSQYLVKTENGLNVDMPEFKASDDEAIQYILKKATRKVKE